MKITNRKSIYEDLSKFSIFADEHDFIEVTEWTNGEGVDVNIEDNSGSRKISLLYDEIEAIVTMSNIIKNNIKWEE